MSDHTKAIRRFTKTHKILSGGILLCFSMALSAIIYMLPGKVSDFPFLWGVLGVLMQIVPFAAGWLLIIGGAIDILEADNDR